MPDKNVLLPDGRVVAFPDSMADADIAAVIKKDLAKNPVTLDFSKAQPLKVGSAIPGGATIGKRVTLDFSKAQPLKAGDAIPSGATIGSPQDLVNDPDFQKLSPAAQHSILSTKFPDKAGVPSGTTPENMAAVAAANKNNSPYPLTSPASLPGVAPSLQKNITGSRPLTPEEQGKENEVFRQGIPLLAANVASEGMSSLPLLARISGVGLTAGLTSGAIGGDPQQTVPLAVGGELGSGAVKFGAEKASAAAQQSLARLLRLSPKAFSFGREPAQEVLEQGISGLSLPKLVENIGKASSQTTAELNDLLKATKGTVNVEDVALNVANNLPGAAANRFLKVVDDAAAKLGYRANQMTSLSAAETNALKQEIARQSKFVEGDMRASVASAGKVFGGKLKDQIISLAPEAEGLLQTSANLTEASKGGDYALRMEKAGRGPVAGFNPMKPMTYLRGIQDTTPAVKVLFRVADAFKGSGIPVSQALRMAFALLYPNADEQ